MSEITIYEHILRKLDELTRKIDAVNDRVENIEEAVTKQAQGGGY